MSDLPVKLVRPKKVKPVNQSVEIVQKFGMLARISGCPSDQAFNFIKAGVFLQPHQLRFAALARECDRADGPKVILCGGGRGSGKSQGIFAQIFCDDCQRVPGSKWLMLRKVGQANKEQVSDFITKLLPNLPHKYREAAPSKVEFPNGSFVILGNFKDEKDIDKYLGLEYDGIYIMESNQLTQTKKANIISCLRTNKTNWRTRVYQDTNPGGIDHCVPHGDVLTLFGWRDIKTIRPGDMVYSVLPNGKMIPSPVSLIHHTKFTGKLVRVDVRGLKMDCTPYHRIAKTGGVRLGKNTRDKKPDKFSLVPFRDLGGQVTVLRSVEFKGIPIDRFTVPDTRKQTTKGKQPKVPKTLTGEQYCELMGWFLAEGCAVKAGEHNFRWTISQIKQPQKDNIRKLLMECGFGFREHGHNFTLCGIEWWTYLNQFGRSRKKFVPTEIRMAEKSQMWKFFKAFMDGDGHWAKGYSSGHAYTISKQLADDLCEIAFKLGFVVSLTTRQMPNRVGLHYSVDFKTVKSGGTELLTGKHRYHVSTKTKRRSDISEIDYDGMVYCLTVPQTENFIIRQNGSIWVSGNCANKSLFIDGRWQWDEAAELYVKIGVETETRYVHSTVDDNAFVDKDYKASVLEKYVGWQRAAWLHGNWEFMAGAFFSNFDRHIHVYPNAQTNLNERAIVRWFAGLDYGYSHPTAFSLCCEDEGGNIFVVAEYGQANTLIEEHAANIRDLCSLNNIDVGDLEFIAAGKDCFRVDKDGSTVATEYQEHGILLTPTQIDRVNAWSQVAEVFGDVKNQIRPRCFIHKNCTNLISQIQSAQSDPKKPNDILKVNASPEGDGSDGDDYLENFRNAIVMAYSSLLKNCRAIQTGGFKPVGSGDEFGQITDISEIIETAEREDLERRSTILLAGARSL